MAALTENRKPPASALPPGTDFVADYAVAANAIVFKGAFVKLGTAGVTPATGTPRVLGYSIDEKRDATGLAAGAITVKTVIGDIIQHAVTGVTGPGDINKTVYAADDQVLTLVATSNGPAGWVYQHITGTTALVKMVGPGNITAPVGGLL